VAIVRVDCVRRITRRGRGGKTVEHREGMMKEIEFEIEETT
jgi:hypothetical protein